MQTQVDKGVMLRERYVDKIEITFFLLYVVDFCYIFILCALLIIDELVEI